MENVEDRYLPKNFNGVDADPFKESHKIFDLCKEDGKQPALQANLATCGDGSQPSVRMIIIKSYDENGLVFVSNPYSKKDSDMHKNPKVALSIWLEKVQTQIRVEGSAFGDLSDCFRRGGGTSGRSAEGVL